MAGARTSRIPKIEFRWPALIFLSFSLIAGWLFHPTVKSFGPTEDPFIFAILFVAATFLLIGLHELGHVLMGWLLGFSFTTLVFTLGMGVKLEKPDKSLRTNKEQFLISIAGPVFHLTMCIAFFFLLAQTELPKTSALYLALAFSLADGVLNLFLPIKKLDGGKAARAFGAIVTGKARAAFPY